MLFWSSPKFLRHVLLLDAATCVSTGALMTLGTSWLSALTAIPAGLLNIAGASLFPIAAFMAFIATRFIVPVGGVWLVIAGNIAWVAASIFLMVGGLIAPNALGHAFIAVQAIAVAALSLLEYRGLRAFGSARAGYSRDAAAPVGR